MFHPSVYFSITHTHTHTHTHTVLWSLLLRNSRPIFTPPCLTLALASNIYTLFTSSPSPQAPFFFQSRTTITYVTAHHTRTLYTFFSYLVFEFLRNIRNQPVSTTIQFPNSFRVITTAENINISVRVLKTFFSIFLQDSMALHQTRHTGTHY